MAIEIDGTKRVGELPSSPVNLTDNIAHEVGTELNRATVQELADVIGTYLGTSDGLAFNPTTVNDGQTLPTTTSNEWLLVGKGTFANVGGGASITTTEELNALTSNGVYWSLSVEIPINIEVANLITQNIRAGYTTTTPSEDAVFKEFAKYTKTDDLPEPKQDYEPMPFTAPTTGVNQEFTVHAGAVAKNVFKSRGLLYKGTEWEQSGDVVTILVNTNINNTIYITF